MTLKFWKRVRTTGPEDDLYCIERKKLVERVEVDCHMDAVNIPSRGDFVDICGKPHLILARMFSLDRDQAFTLNGAPIICPQLIVDYEVENSTYEGINRENRSFLFTLPALEDQEGYSDPTAYAALSKIEREEAHIRKLKAALSQVCELSGYSLKGQISLVDKKTGQTYCL